MFERWALSMPAGVGAGGEVGDGTLGAHIRDVGSWTGVGRRLAAGPVGWVGDTQVGSCAPHPGLRRTTSRKLARLVHERWVPRPPARVKAALGAPPRWATASRRLASLASPIGLRVLALRGLTPAPGVVGRSHESDGTRRGTSLSERVTECARPCPRRPLASLAVIAAAVLLLTTHGHSRRPAKRRAHHRRGRLRLRQLERPRSRHGMAGAAPPGRQGGYRTHPRRRRPSGRTAHRPPRHARPRRSLTAEPSSPSTARAAATTTCSARAGRAA